MSQQADRSPPGPPNLATQPAVATSNPSQDNPLGLIAMVCGLLSLIMGCPLSIAAIVLGFLGRKKEPKGMATTGLALGAATLTLQVLFGCLLTAVLVVAGATAEDEETAATRQRLRETAASVEFDQMQHGVYPSDEDGSVLANFTNDAWGNPILYRLDHSVKYVVTSCGPDGTLDTSDDLTYDGEEYEREIGPMPE